MIDRNDPLAEIFATASLSGPEDEPTQANIFSAFGVTPPEPAATEPDPQGATDDPEPTEPPATEPEPGAAEPDGDDPEPAGEPEPDPEPKPQTVPDTKAAQAFAQMRVKNKQYETMLGDIAQVLGVQDAGNPEQMMEALQQRLIQAQAQASGIPEEMLRRQRDTDAKLDMYEKNQLRTQAYLGFQKVKDTFGLTDVELSSFADKLVASGRNPFEGPMDLTKEYRTEYFDQILEKERAKAREEEATRQKKVLTHGTTPATKDGKSVGEPGKINTVKALNNWFDQQK